MNPLSFMNTCLKSVSWQKNKGLKITKWRVWRSKTHSDGSKWDNWFVLGIYATKSKQITYHIPMDRWNDTSFAETMSIAPQFDGHTPVIILKRLKTL